MSIFKAYDIRGLYPQEITADVARKVGRAMVKLTGAETIAVGRDMRASGEVLMQALCEGIAYEGAKVVDVGLVSTPLFYFSVREFAEHEAGIMITASHNPAVYNGFKLTRADGMPIGQDSGMRDIEKMVGEMDDGCSASRVIEKKNTLDAYIQKLFSLVNPNEIGELKVVVDAGNGMAGYVVPEIFSQLSCEMQMLYFELDGNFPNHEANPIVAENMRVAMKNVVEIGADIGVGYDGDADRIAFIDEKGSLISGDITTALLAREILVDHPGARILYDIRGSKAIGEMIEEAGGTYGITRVGHAFIKEQMKKENALMAGELSGHFYFEEFGRMDTSDYALLLMLRLLTRSKKSLSQLVSEVRRYAHSGEINFDVEDKEKVLDRLKNRYQSIAKKFSEMDGLLFDFGDWWFNVRPSNTEPKLRLNLEAKDVEMMEEKKQEIISLILA